jgi:hypothetical protein
MAKAQGPKDIDQYIATFPTEFQMVLEKVRQTIRDAAPDAKETISYQMPAFEQHGILVYFAAWTKRIGLYPPISGDKTLERAVARYVGPKVACSPFFGPPHKGDCLEHLNASKRMSLRSLLSPPPVADCAELFGRRVAK